MKSRQILFSIVFLLLLTQIAPPASCQSARNSFEFGYVKSDYDWAGESIWLANTKMEDRVSRKSVAALRADGLGKISINGNDIDLKIIKHYLPNKNRRVRRGGYQIWKGRNVTLRIDYIFTKLCPLTAEECLVRYFKGIMDVAYKGQRRKVRIIGFGGS